MDKENKDIDTGLTDKDEVQNTDLDDNDESDAAQSDAPNDEKPEKEKDNRSLGDKIDDTLDEVVARTQDFFYGERVDSTEDIPATMPDPDNEIRHINKVQTRRNILHRLLKHKGCAVILYGFLAVFLVTLLVGVIRNWIIG